MRAQTKAHFLTVIVLAMILVNWDRPSATPLRIVADAAPSHSAASDHSAALTSFWFRSPALGQGKLLTLMAKPGDHAVVPELASERLDVSKIQAVPSLAPSTRRQIVEGLSAFLPCGDQYVDEIFILRHPGRLPTDPLARRDHFLAGVVSVSRSDEDSPPRQTDMTVRLYLFLPPDLLDGSGLKKPLNSTNIIPYAGAPTPETLSDFLTWTLAHESWHLTDVQARLVRIRDEDQSALSGVEYIAGDPQRWAQEYDEVSVAEYLGWQDYDESYAMSDEMARTFTMQAGRTEYSLENGAIQIGYTDDLYSFERQFRRQGYLPPELQTLSDLQSLLKSGRYPTLYGLFNTEEERFAEYGAWYLYAASVGGGDQFRALFPELHEAFEQRWQAASSQCQKRDRPIMDTP